MKPLPLGAGSNLEIGCGIALLVAILLPFCVLLVVDARKVLSVRGSRGKGLMTFGRFDQRAGRLIKPGSRLALWAVILSLGVVALAMAPFEGFIGVQYDSERLQLDYRYSSEPVTLTWSDVNSVRLFKTKPRGRLWRITSHIEITRQGGPVYKSRVASTAEGRELLFEAAKELHAAKRKYGKLKDVRN